MPPVPETGADSNSSQKRVVEPIACAHCNTSFTPKSRKAQYCSAKCRVYAHRCSKHAPGNELSKVEAVVSKSGLKPAERKRVIAAVTRETNAVFKQLSDNYHDSLNKMLNQRLEEEFGKERDRLAELEGEYARREKAIKQAQRRLTDSTLPITSLMTEKEYNLLRSFCHPDKNVGNAKKAQTAFQIVQKLEKSVPVYFTKKDFEITGWSKKKRR